MEGKEQLISINDVDTFFTQEGKDPARYRSFLEQHGFIHRDPDTGEEFVRVIRPPPGISKSTPEIVQADSGLVGMLGLSQAAPIQRADGTWFIAKADLATISGTTRHNAMRLVQENVYNRRMPNVQVINGEAGDTSLVLIEMIDGTSLGKEHYNDELNKIIQDMGSQSQTAALQRESLFQGVVSLHTGSTDAEQFVSRGSDGLENIIRLDDEFGYLKYGLSTDTKNVHRYYYDNLQGENLVTYIKQGGAGNDVVTLGVRKQDYYIEGVFQEDKFKQDFDAIIDEVIEGVYDSNNAARYKESLLQAGISEPDAEKIIRDLKKGSRTEAKTDLEAKIRKLIDCDGSCFVMQDGRYLTPDEFVDAMQQRLIQSGISPDRIKALKTIPGEEISEGVAVGQNIPTPVQRPAGAVDLPAARKIDAELPATKVVDSNLPQTPIIDSSAERVVDTERLNPDMVAFGNDGTAVSAPPDVVPPAVTSPAHVVPTDTPTGTPAETNKAFFEGEQFRKTLLRESIQPDGTRFVQIRVDAAGRVDPQGTYRVTLRNNIREGTFSTVGVPAELGADARRALDDSVAELNKLEVDRDALNTLDTLDPVTSHQSDAVLDVNPTPIPPKNTPPPLPTDARGLDADEIGAVIEPTILLDEADAQKVEKNLAALESQGVVLRVGEDNGKKTLQIEVPVSADKTVVDNLVAENKNILGDDIEHVVVTQGSPADSSNLDNAKIVHANNAVAELDVERVDDLSDLLHDLPQDTAPSAAPDVESVLTIDDADIPSEDVIPEELPTLATPPLPTATVTPNEVTLENLIAAAEREARTGNAEAENLLDSYKAKLAQLQEYEAYQKRGAFSRFIDWMNPFHEPPVKPKVIVESDLERRLLSEVNKNIGVIGERKLNDGTNIVPFGDFDESVTLPETIPRVLSIRDVKPGTAAELDVKRLKPNAQKFLENNGFTGRVQRLGESASKDLERSLGSALEDTIVHDLDLYQAVRMQREDGSWWYVKLALDKTNAGEANPLERLVENTIFRDGVRQILPLLFLKRKLWIWEMGSKSLPRVNWKDT